MRAVIAASNHLPHPHHCPPPEVLFDWSDNVSSVAPPIFRHRLIPNFAAQSEGLNADDIAEKIIEEVPKFEA